MSQMLSLWQLHYSLYYKAVRRGRERVLFGLHMVLFGILYAGILQVHSKFGHREFDLKA